MQIRMKGTRSKKLCTWARIILSLVLSVNLVVSLVPVEAYAFNKDKSQIERELQKQSREFDEEKSDLEKAEQAAKKSATGGDDYRENKMNDRVKDELTDDSKAADDAAEDAESNDDAVLRAPETEAADSKELEGELISQDEYSRTYRIDEKTYVTRISSEPHLYKEDGEEKEIDNTLEENGEVYVNADNTYEITLPKEGREVTVEGEGYEISMKPLFGKLDNAAARDNAIRYNDVTGSVDLQYEACTSHIKEDIILMEPQAKTVFEYELLAKDPDGKDLVARAEDGFINIYRSAGKTGKDKEENETPVYIIDAPLMEDANGEISYDVSLELEKKSEKQIVRVIADPDWLNDPGRAYPVKIDPSVSITLGQDNMEWHLVENGRSGGDYLAGPDVNHRYVTYMYAGYEDGTLMGGASSGARYGYTRSFLKIDYDFKKLKSNNGIPANAIMTANFRIYKFRGSPKSGTKVFCKMVNDGWKGGSDYTWYNKPTDYTIIGSAVDVSQNGWKSFDITDAVKAWEKGTANRGLVLVPEKENQDAVVFSGPGNPATGLPLYLDITWKLPNEVDADYPLDAPKVDLWPLSTVSGGKQLFTGLLGTGVVRPGLNADYTLEEVNGGAVAASGVFSNASNLKTFPDTDRMSENISYRLGYSGINSGNFQTKGLKADLMKYTTPYHIAATGKKGSVSTPKGTSDDFIIYQFTLKDTFPYVAQFYGVSLEQILKDNRPSDYIGTTGSTIFIRSPKKNRTTAYTRPAKLDPEHAEDLVFANLGRGLCADYDLEPVNTSNGNFTLQQTDAENEDYLEGFGLTRTYNSVGDKERGLFGYGWSFEWDKSITADGEDYIYKPGDGRHFRFTKTGSDAYTCELMPELTLTASKDTKNPEKSKYTITDEKENKVCIFNCYGLFTGVQDKYGDEVKTERDAAGNISRIVTASGRIYSFALNDDGTVKEITVPSGHKLKYEYTGGCLSGFTNADGDRISYTYDKDLLMTEYADGEGNRQILNEYDEYGRVIKQTDANGGVSTMTYGASGTEVCDAEGNERKYTFDERLRTTSRKTEGGKDRREYDEDNNLVYEKDGEGNETRYVYDADGNVTKIIRFDGKIKTASYDAGGNPASETDFDGNETTRTFDSRDNLLSETYADGSSIRYTYDSHGRITSKTDENGNAERITYYGTSKAEITDKNGNLTVVSYDDMGRETSRVNAEGIEEGASYTPDGKTSGVSISGGFSESYAYDHAGNCVKITDAEGGSTRFTYDAFGNITTETDPNGNRARYSYDALGNEIKKSSAEGSVTRTDYDAESNISAITDPNGNTTKYVYDCLGRVEAKINPEGGRYSYEYEGDTKNVTSKVDENGKTEYRYDGRGNLIYVKTQSGAVTEYTYDERSRLIEEKQPAGLVITYTYDAAGNMLSKKDSNGREESYTWDKEGNMLSFVNALGEKTEYGYDRTGRLILKKTADGNTYSYTYDQAGNILTESLNGEVINENSYDRVSRLKSCRDANGNETSYGYDASGNEIRRTDALGASSVTRYDGDGRIESETDRRGFTRSYGYDGNGNITRYTDEIGGVFTEKFDSFGNAVSSTSSDGSRIESEYDEYGRLVKESDANGYVKKYAYDSVGNLKTESDNEGHSKSYTYDKTGRLISTKDAAGRIESYEYDQYGNIVKEVDAGKDTLLHEYDALDRETVKTENDGTKCTYTYDKAGNLTSETLPGERVYEYKYDSRGNTTAETDPEGNVRKYRYDKVGNLLEETNEDGTKYSYEYDKAYRLTRETNEEGGIVCYEYDAEGNITKETDPNGNATEFIYDGVGNEIKRKDARGAVTESVYGKSGMLQKVIYPEGGTEEYIYDASGNVKGYENTSGAKTNYTYSGDGRLLKVRLDNGYETSYAYDKADRITIISTSEGAKWAYTYDKNGNIANEKEPTGNVNTYTYDNMHRMLSSKNGKGAITSFKYNRSGDLIEVKYPTGGKLSYSYDKLSRVLSEEESTIAKVTYRYDERGNLKSHSQKAKKTVYAYDRTGNLKAEKNDLGHKTSYTYDANGNMTGVTDALGRKTGYSYDEANNLIKITDARGAEIKYTYDKEGNVTSETNRLGAKKTYAYDKAGRLRSARDEEGRTVTYTYNRMDDLTEVTEPDGSKISFSYDKAGNLTKEVTAEKRTTRFTYDAAGHLTAKINPDGSKISYDYDKLGALTSRKYSDGSTSVIYGYDAQGNRVTMSDESGSSKTTYDSIGRVKTYTDGKGQTLKYSYDEYDRVSEIEYPNNRTVHYTYDTEDNIIRIEDSKGLDADYTYDAVGNALSCKRSDGTKSEYSYDDNDNLLILKNTKDKKLISEYTYAYDADDKIISEKEERGGDTKETAFTYDKSGVLTSYTEKESGQTRKTVYSYDAAGNRVSTSKGGGEGTVKVIYNKDGQIVRKTDSKTGAKVTYKYDKNGNLIQKKGNGKSFKYEYDIENRLRVVSEGGQVLMAATYDGDGNKVFQLSRKHVGTEKPVYAGEEGDDDDPDPDDGKVNGKSISSDFDPDMFWYGVFQSGTKLAEAFTPALIPETGMIIREAWEGIRTFITDEYTDSSGTFRDKDALSIEDLEGIVVAGTERGTRVTYDATNYLNDTNFNLNTQVVYQYDNKLREKASYVYGETDERLSADLTSGAVEYSDKRAGNYTYIYDGEGNVTSTLRKGKTVDRYEYSPFGVPENVDEDEVFFGYNGEETIASAGIQYLRSRYLSNDDAVFTSRDTESPDPYTPQSQNRYLYAESDPVNANDPGGHKKTAKKTSIIKRAVKAVTNTAKKVVKAAKTVVAAVKAKVQKSSPQKQTASQKGSNSKNSGGSGPSNSSGLSKLSAYANTTSAAVRNAVKAASTTIHDAKAIAKDLSKKISCGATKAYTAVKEKVTSTEKKSSTPDRKSVSEASADNQKLVNEVGNKIYQTIKGTPVESALVIYDMTGGSIQELANLAAYYGYVKITGDTTSTYASTVTGSLGLLIGGGASYGYAVDGSGNIVKIYSYEAQGITGINAFAGRGISVSDADSLITWLENKSYGGDIGGGVLGVSATGGLHVGYDVGTNQNYYTEIDLAAGIGLPGLSGDVAITSSEKIGEIYKLNGWGK